MHSIEKAHTGTLPDGVTSGRRVSLEGFSRNELRILVSDGIRAKIDRCSTVDQYAVTSRLVRCHSTLRKYIFHHFGLGLL